LNVLSFLPSFLLALVDSREPGNCELSQRKEIKSITDPPLNAPTGFRTGAAAAVSCKRRLEVWNDLVGVKMGRARERDELVERRDRILEAMIADAMSAPAVQVLQERLIQVATTPFACRTVWAGNWQFALELWSFKALAHLASILRRISSAGANYMIGHFRANTASSSGMESRDMGAPLMT
jgi:hypothetical protein